MDEDRVVNKLLDHDREFGILREELQEFRREYLQGYDEMMTILKRLDQERIFTSAWVKRIEKQVEEHTAEIRRIKLQLQIA